ncbi:hypothetical protein [Apibacter sp. HY039]|uniref:hypothetical protein n=1 Tax=Apibacter sp. HY039 TaxID=2501476 RepID=UPI000FEC06D0|nr:hypothetical protein [Apibacter sp. HY039]
MVKLQEAGLQQNPSDQSKSMDDLGNDIGSATDIGNKTVGDRTSQFVTQELSSFVRLDDIEEHGSVSTRQSRRINGTIVGINQMGISHIERKKFKKQFTTYK